MWLARPPAETQFWFRTKGNPPKERGIGVRNAGDTVVTAHRNVFNTEVHSWRLPLPREVWEPNSH